MHDKITFHYSIERMGAETLRLRSTIKPSLLRRVLLRGSILAILGACILLYANIFISVDELSTWGLLIVCIALTLIAIGLIPYRKLTRLERHPYEMIAAEQIVTLKKDNPLFSFPINSIEKIAYIEQDNSYGIGIWLKNPEKILLHIPKFEMNRFKLKTQQHDSCDLFLPYFSERSCKSLEDFYTLPEEE